MRLSIAKRYGLAAVALWSTAATAFKLALASSEPCMVVLSASVVSLAFLAVLCASTGARLSWRIMLRALPRGFLNPFVYYLVLLEAYDRLPAQIAMVVNYLWPVVLVLLHAAAGRRRLRAGSLLAEGAYDPDWQPEGFEPGRAIRDMAQPAPAAASEAPAAGGLPLK